MRLIGIGLLAFLLAGLALLLARSEVVGQSFRAARTLMDGPQLRFETPMAAEAQRGADQAVILRASSSAPLILSGLPAYQRAVFHMPIDARPISGYLQIDATTQVLAGVEGVLRISIDNIRRAEVLLRPGESVRAVRIELTPADISRAQLVVSFSLLGAGADLVCSSDHSVEAVVEIETTSAVYLSLDAPLESARDRVAAWGNQVRLVWNGEVETLLSAVRARQFGEATLIVPESGLDSETAEAALKTEAAAASVPEFAWSKAMSPTGGLFGLRRFQHSHTWRLRYDFHDALNGNRPGVFHLAMALPSHPLGAHWQITVTQNNRLLSHFSGNATQTRVDRRILIPAHSGVAHVIEITMTSTHERKGECNDGPELLAEILPDTRILPSDELFADSIRSLILALKEESSVSLGITETLNAAEANIATDLLEALVPDTSIVVASQIPTVAVLPRGASFSAKEESWLVFYDETGSLVVSPAAQNGNEPLRAVSLLVHLPGHAT
ncbi:MAG: hypothetical protein OXC60_18530 [Litoreibacter sp.]|nr:hypothetical protein [Litoreibacter sp.]